MSIDTDIELIESAESGEVVRNAIISAIQDLNQNGGNAQTLNNHNSDDFTKKSEFDAFTENEVGQIHQVLDAINKGTTLKVIDLGTHTIGTAAGTLDITVPRSISDRSLLSVDDFYADIVSVAGGNGANASWTKSATYDSVQGIYHYTYGALATQVTLHFYVKRASAIAVTDYDVHHLVNDITSNGPYAAPAGEAWDYVNVQVPGSKTETTLNAVINNYTYEQPQQSNETWSKVIVDVPGPELQTGSVSVTENNYHNTFTPSQGKDGFSSFEVDVNVPFNTQSKSVDVDSINFSDTVVPDSGYAGLSQVVITSSLELEDPITVRQNGPVPLSSGKVGFSDVTVAVPVPVVETGRSVTYSSGGTYTVNPTGNNDAMDSVEVTVQTPVLQSSKSVTLSQSGTVTVTPDSNYNAMEEVVVTVSGGGGANVMTKADWDLLTIAQKKQQGLTVIRNSQLEFTGEWYDLTNAGSSEYIPYSALVICDAHINNFDSTAYSWGDGAAPFTLGNLLTANSDGIGVNVNGRSGDTVYCDLGDINTDFTAYLVFRYSENYSYCAVIGASYQESGNNCEYITEDSINRLTGVCGNRYVVGTDHTADTYIAVAIRNNNKTISFFKNGIKGTDLTANMVGRYVTIATQYPNLGGYGTNITVAYAGVVSEAERDSIVSSNIANLMNKFNIT